MFKCIKEFRTIKKGTKIPSDQITQDIGRLNFYTITYKEKSYMLTPKSMWTHFIIINDEVQK